MKKAMLNEYALNGYTVNSNLPIGIVIPSFSDVVPVGFLNCDHTKLKQSDFPELWNELKNVPMCQSEEEGYFFTPDLREVSLVGTGENGTLDITAHDVYALGEFKDDQFQGHFHRIKDDGKNEGGGTNRGALGDPTHSDSSDLFVEQPISDGTNGDPRIGTTTHGKQVGVKWIIKATQYASLEQNAIDDTRTTNTNVHSALKTQADIANAKKWNYLGQDTVQLPTEWNEIIIQIYNNDYSVVVGEIHILNLSYTNNTTFTTACGGSSAYERSLWELNISNNSISNIGGVFSKGKSYYR